MKAVILAIAIAGVATTAPLNAQVLGTRLPTPSTSTSTVVNGSWQVVGRDRGGNTIYERRTYDANGNIVIQRARRDGNGNFSVISSRTERRNNNDCQYANSTGSVGDIIFGRNGTNGTTADCRGNRRGSVDGVWRQVGHGRNNNSVYERRTYDGYGNIVVQKARRNPNGSFTILSTRTIRGDRNVRNRDGDDDDYRGYNRRDNDDERYKSSERGNHGNSERGNHGRGKGHKG